MPGIGERVPLDQMWPRQRYDPLSKLRDHAKRIYDQERRPDPENIPLLSISGRPSSFPFTAKHRVYLEGDYDVRRIRLNVGDASGSGTVNAHVLLNGDEDEGLFPELVVPINGHTKVILLGCERTLSEGDWLQGRINSAGAGASHFTMQIRALRYS